VHAGADVGVHSTEDDPGGCPLGITNKSRTERDSCRKGQFVPVRTQGRFADFALVSKSINVVSQCAGVLV
jgi:hypothetical protein